MTDASHRRDPVTNPDVLPQSGTAEGEWAWQLGWDCLGLELPRRWGHSLRAASQAASVQSILTAEDAPLLQTAALLHDIGYASTLVRTGFHPIDGADHLRSLGVDERIVSLVAHHSCAGTEAALRGLTEDQSRFPHPKDPLVYDAMVWCDMTSGPAGAVVTVEWRLGDILSRYPPESIVGRAIAVASPMLREASARTERRLATSAHGGTV